MIIESKSNRDIRENRVYFYCLLKCFFKLSAPEFSVSKKKVSKMFDLIFEEDSD